MWTLLRFGKYVCPCSHHCNLGMEPFLYAPLQLILTPQFTDPRKFLICFLLL